MQVYKITNNVNGKVYIGKDTSDNPNYFGSGLLIKRAIKKYGIENFEKEILTECDNHDYLCTFEKLWIKHFNSTDPSIGYNISDGGDGGDVLSNHPDRDKLRKKQSDNNFVRGKTYEEAFGKEKAAEYKKKLSDNHPRLSHKELMSPEVYEQWLEKRRGPKPERRKGKEVPCDCCGNLVYRMPSKIKEKNYCSNSCSNYSKNVNTKWINNPETGEKRKIKPSEELPEGFVYGTGKKN